MLVFALCLLLGLAVAWRRAAVESQRREAQTRTAALAHLAAIETGFNRALGAAETVAALVRQGGGRASGFQQVVQDFIERAPGLAAVQLEPGGVVIDVAPRAGNERVVGRNLMADPLGRESVLAALRRQMPVLAGPLIWEGGQLVVIGRYPVLLAGPGGREQAWGCVAAVIRLRELLLAARFEELAARGYDYVFYTDAAPLQPGGVIAASGSGNSTRALVQPLRLANLELRLAVRPRAGWYSAGDMALDLLAFAALGGLLALWLVRQERQQQSAAALAEANQRAARGTERFRGLLHAVPEALLLADRQGVIQLLNPSAERLLGLERGQLIGQPVNRVVPDLAALLANTSRSPRETPFAMVAQRPDGTEFPVEITPSSLVGETGETVTCLALRDVSARQGIEQELADRLALNRALLDLASNPVLLIDAEGRFLRGNRAAESALGVTPALFEGKSALDLQALSPEARRALHSACQTAATEPGARTLDLSVVTSDGLAHLMHVTVRGIRRGDDSPAGTIIHLEDRAADQQRESQRRQQSDELAQANLLAEIALGLTRAGAWRVPLDGSGGCLWSPELSALFGQPARPDRRYRVAEDWFAPMEAGDPSAARRAADNFNAAVEGRVPQHDAVYAYRRPADDVVIRVRSVGRVLKDAAGRPSEVVGVAHDVTEITRPPDERTGARPLTQPLPQPAEPPREPPAPPRDPPAAIAESPAPDVIPSPVAEESGPPAGTGPEVLRGVRVLLAEPDEADRQHAIGILAGAGARVTLANTGAEVVNALLATPTAFDLVLLSLRMPEMDGHEAARRIRTDGRFHTLPILALAGDATPQELRRSRMAGISACLAKPIVAAALVEACVRASIPAEAPAASAASPEPAPEQPPRAVEDSATPADQLPEARKLIQPESTGQAPPPAVQSASGDEGAERSPPSARSGDTASAGPHSTEPPSAASAPILDRTLAATAATALAAVSPARSEPTPTAEVPSPASPTEPSQPAATANAAEPAPVSRPVRRRRPRRDDQLKLFGGDSADVPPPAATTRAPEPVSSAPEAESPSAAAPSSPAASPKTEPSPPVHTRVPDSPATPLDQSGEAAPIAPSGSGEPASLPDAGIVNEFALAPAEPNPPLPPEDPVRQLEVESEPELAAGPPPQKAREPSAPTEAAEGANEYAGIDGLNATDGLRRASGSQRTYRRRLRQFVEQQSHAPEEIRDLLMHGDSGAAARVTAALAGLADDLGAGALHDAATQLGQAIRSGADPSEIEDRWSATERHLSCLVRDLKPLVSPRSDRAASAVEPPPPEFQPAEWRRLANQMLPLLGDQDPGAADCLAANRDAFRSAFTADAYAEFEQHVTEGEFVEALEVLKRVARRRGVNLH